MRYFPILITLFAISCSNQFKTEIKEIDALISSLDSAKKVLYSLDTGKVNQRISESTKNINFIIQNLDSATKETAYLIDDYSSDKKYYTKISHKFPTLFEEVETVPVQLKNLKNDLSKNLIEREQAENYLLNESIAAKSIIKTIGGIKSRLSSLDSTYSISNEKILHLIQSIDSKKSDSIDS